MNLYECEEMIAQIEAKAEENDGDISPDDLAALVQAQTTSLNQLEKLVNYLKYLDGLCSLAKLEVDRLMIKRRMAEKRIESIKGFLKPWLLEHGPVNVGTHRLLLRKSQGVVLAEGFNNLHYGENVTTFKANKKAIKESILNGIEVKGAILEDRVNVQIR